MPSLLGTTELGTTDLIGTNRIVGPVIASEEATILSELLYPKVSEFDGRIVKTTGDGALIEFLSAVNAVLCSVAVQREMDVILHMW